MTDRVRAKKHLGQHFLAHKPTAERIVSSLVAVEPDLVLEIGPGMGVLTDHLSERFGEKLWLVEIDPESVAYLIDKFPDLESRILRQDFLKLDLETLKGGRMVVIGNFPYNISSQILFHLLDYRDIVTEIVGMFQREVARRIVSGPGTREYGILSVLMGAFYEGSYLFTVDEHHFRPPPKVKSGVVRFVRRPDISLPCKPETFYRTVKIAFNQRRKTLRNALSSYWSDELEGTGFGGLRAEQLGVPEFLILAEQIDKKEG